MAAKREIGTTIKLDGEARFKSALSSIGTELRVLSSEMAATTSAFDKNGASIGDLQAKGEVLNKQLETQQKKHETLNAAINAAQEAYQKAQENAAKVSAEYGENSVQAQKAAKNVSELENKLAGYQIQANRTTAEENKLKNAIDENNTAIEEMEKGLDGLNPEIEETGEQSEEAAGKTSILGENLKTGLVAGAKAAAAAVAAVGTAAVAAGKAIWDMANDTASTGDNIDKMSQKIGISAESYQEWDYVFQLCGTDIDNLQTGMKTLSTVITDAAAGSDTAAEKLAAVGLSIEDLNGLSQEEQLNLVISSLQDMDSGAERTAAACDLLGKSATDMAALLNTSSEATEAMKQEAQDYGLIMSDKAVAASAAFEDSLTKLQGTVSGFKNSITAELLPGITEIMNGLSDLVAGNDEAAGEIESGVTSVLDGLTSAIPKFTAIISTIAAAVLQAAPTILTSLAQGIVGAITELVPVAAEIITELVSGLLELLPQIAEAAIQIITSLVQSLTESLPELIPAAVEIVMQIIQTIVDNLPLVIEAGLQLLVALVEALPDAIVAIVAAIPSIINGLITAITESLPQIIEAGITLFISLIEALPDIIIAIVEAIPQIITGLITAIVSSLPQMIQAGIDLFIALIGALPDIIVAIVDAIPQIITGLVTAFSNPDTISTMMTAGFDLFVALIENLPEIIVAIVEAIPDIITGIVDGFLNFVGTIKDIGLNLISGIADGLANGIDYLKEKISGIGETIINGFKDFFGIASPSKLMKEQVGAYLAEGVGEGFTEGMEEAQDDMQGSLPTSFELDTELTGYILESTPEIIADLEAKIETIAAAINEKFLSMQPDFEETGYTLFTSLPDKAKEIQLALQPKLLKIYEMIKKVFTDKSEDFKNVGYNLMIGLGDGFTDAVSNAVGVIQAGAGAIISALKEFFAISSPSRVMKDEVGAYLAEGIGVGFTEKMAEVSVDMARSVPISYDLSPEITSSRSDSGAGMSYGFVQNIYSPKALSAYEVARQTKMSLQLARIER